MTIHTEHPFASSERDPGRQFRGQLGGRVSLWTSGTGHSRAGLTVGSLIACHGDPWHLVAALDPDADLTETLLACGRAAVSLLGADQRGLAEAFAGGPAPGGPFALTEWTPTSWGPVPSGTTTWAGVDLVTSTEIGWSLLVTCRVAEFTIGSDERPLLHRHGRYLA